VLLDLGDLVAARAELERALAVYEATYGPGHPSVGTIRGNLGGVLRELGRADPGAAGDRPPDG
jgi:Tetratricopeptide repeat